MNGVVKAERELTRSEIVRGLLGAPIEKSLLHSSSSLRFLADTVVPTYIGAWVRIWLVRRYDAPRATKAGALPTPTIGHSINHVSLDLGKLAASEHVFEDVSRAPSARRTIAWRDASCIAWSY